MDALAALGQVFDRAYATISWTLPSHAAPLTGFYDYTHGARDSHQRLAEQTPTLARVLRRSGIRAFEFFSGPYLHPSFGMDQGFEEYRDCTSYRCKDCEGRAPHAESHRDVTNPILLEEIGDWAANADSGERHFIFIHMWDVHYDYIAPQQYVDMFDPGYKGVMSGEGLEENKAIRPGMPERDLRHLLAQYDAEIRYTDDTLGQILRILEERGLMENAAVIVLADHGEEFLDHGHKEHGKTLYEEVVRIPLILHIGGRCPAAPRVDALVSIIDLYPTVCELFGVSCDYAGAGMSLLPFYRGDNMGWPKRVVLLDLTRKLFKFDDVGVVRRADKLIRSDRYGVLWYIRVPESGVERDELRLRRKQLADSPPAVTDALQDLEGEIARAEEARRRLYPSEVDQEAAVDESTQEQLRSLGYVE